MSESSDIHQLFCRYCLRAKTFYYNPSQDSVILPTANFDDNLTKNSLSYLWYLWQRDLVNLIKSDEGHELLDIISKYIQDDDQFPPDLLKLLRLKMVLEELKPDCIIEIGCGTSSLILSNESLKRKTPFLCIDSSSKWLKTTEAKIEKSINNKINDAIFYNHQSWDDTIKKIIDFSSGKKKIFFYLDAVLDSSIDHYQGLKTIIDGVDSNTSQINIMIDSRKKAVANLHHLASKLDKSLMISTNLVNYAKSQSGNARVFIQNVLDDCFLKMTAATFVSSLCP